MSLHLRYISFLWQVADLGCNLNMPLLRDGARVLMKLMPPGLPQVESIRRLKKKKKKSTRRFPHGLTCTSRPPADNTTVENLRAVCLDHAKLGENSLSPSLDSRFFGPSPSQVLYLIEVSGSEHRQSWREIVFLHCMHMAALKSPSKTSFIVSAATNSFNLFVCLCS